MIPGNPLLVHPTIYEHMCVYIYNKLLFKRRVPLDFKLLAVSLPTGRLLLGVARRRRDKKTFPGDQRLNI